MRSQSQFPNTADRPAPANGSIGERSVAARQPPPDVLRPRALQRIQTGMSSGSPVGVSGLDKEFEMSLRLGPLVNSPESDGVSPRTTEILAPKPRRPVQPPPPVYETPEPRVIKKEIPSGDLRNQFKEGDALRMRQEDGTLEDLDDLSPRDMSSSRIGAEGEQPTR